jgi:hypothetical protein
MSLARFDEKIRMKFASPICPPRYAPTNSRVIKCLRATVDNQKPQARISFCFRGTARIFPFVVGHESGRRNWKTAPVTESGFFEAKSLRSN